MKMWYRSSTSRFNTQISFTIKFVQQKNLDYHNILTILGSISFKTPFCTFRDNVAGATENRASIS
jgi:hypothetical protein